MRNVIIRIIKEGWKKNQSVLEVISNIMFTTGLSRKAATSEFTQLAFAAKPKRMK